MSDSRSSIVLNQRHSIHLAEQYWSAFRKEIDTLVVRHGIRLEQDLPKKSLSYPLAYYNWRESAQFPEKDLQALLKLERDHLKGHEYTQMKALVSACGLDAPSDSQLVDISESSGVIEDALRLIRLVWPDAYEETLALMTGVCWIADEDVRSFTNPIWFGAVFLNAHSISSRNVFEVSVSLLHEIGHLALFAQCSVEPPIKDMKSELFSPFKGTDRPALGVLHAQMALARMILWLHHLKHFLSGNPESEASHQVSQLISEKKMSLWLAEFAESYLDGMDSVRKMEPTESGQDIIADFRKIEDVLR